MPILHPIFIIILILLIVGSIIEIQSDAKKKKLGSLEMTSSRMSQSAGTFMVPARSGQAARVVAVPVAAARTRRRRRLPGLLEQQRSDLHVLGARVVGDVQPSVAPVTMHMVEPLRSTTFLAPSFLRTTKDASVRPSSMLTLNTTQTTASVYDAFIAEIEVRLAKLKRPETI